MGLRGIQIDTISTYRPNLGNDFTSSTFQEPSYIHTLERHFNEPSLFIACTRRLPSGCDFTDRGERRDLLEIKRHELQPSSPSYDEASPPPS